VLLEVVVAVREREKRGPRARVLEAVRARFCSRLGELIRLSTYGWGGWVRGAYLAMRLR
jgi:hypothetical protein